MSSYSSLIILYHFMTDIQLFIFVTNLIRVYKHQIEDLLPYGAKYWQGQILTNWGNKNFEKPHQNFVLYSILMLTPPSFLQWCDKCCYWLFTIRDGVKHWNDPSFTMTLVTVATMLQVICYEQKLNYNYLQYHP